MTMKSPPTRKSLICHPFCFQMDVSHLSHSDHPDPEILSLTDDQILPLLLRLGPVTLVNYAKAHPRLHGLVCEPQVWRWLLRGIPEFSAEKLEELVLLGAKKDPSLMQEILREVASRLTADDESGMKLTLNIKAWDAEKRVEIYSFSWEHIVTVADAVKANFTIVEVQAVNFSRFFRAILNFVRLQGVKLDKLELDSINLPELFMPHSLAPELIPNLGHIFSSLLGLCKKWKIGNVVMANTGSLMDIENYWSFLARNTATGHIGTLRCSSLRALPKIEEGKPFAEDVRNVWEISEEVIVFKGTIKGGRGGALDPVAEWKLLMDQM